MEDTGEKSTMSTASFLTFARLLVLMTLSWSQPGKAAPTSNDYDPEGSRPNVEESANGLSGCCSATDCKDYRGLLSYTQSGMKCVRWEDRNAVPLLIVKITGDYLAILRVV